MCQNQLNKIDFDSIGGNFDDISVFWKLQSDDRVC